MSSYLKCFWKAYLSLSNNPWRTEAQSSLQGWLCGHGLHAVAQGPVLEGPHASCCRRLEILNHSTKCSRFHSAWAPQFTQMTLLPDPQCPDRSSDCSGQMHLMDYNINSNQPSVCLNKVLLPPVHPWAPLPRSVPLSLTGPPTTITQTSPKAGSVPTLPPSQCHSQGGRDPQTQCVWGCNCEVWGAVGFLTRPGAPGRHSAFSGISGAGTGAEASHWVYPPWMADDTPGLQSLGQHPQSPRPCPDPNTHTPSPAPQKSQRTTPPGTSPLPGSPSSTPFTFASFPALSALVRTVSLTLSPSACSVSSFLFLSILYSRLTTFFLTLCLSSSILEPPPSPSTRS